MSEERPRLTVVGEDPARPQEPGSGAPRSAPESSRRLLWIAAFVAGVCALGWISSARDASRLESSLAATRAELATTRERVRAYDLRIGQLRERARALTVQMEGLAAEAGALEALADADPQAPPPASEGSDAAPGTSGSSAHPAPGPAGSAAPTEP